MWIRTLLALLLVSTALAAEPIGCPEAINVTSPKLLIDSLRGWIPTLDDSPHILSGITLFDGVPEEHISLAPDRETKRNDKIVSVWKLAPYTHFYWLVCHYSGTALNLSRPLPKNFTECTVTYDATEQVAGLPKIKSMACH